VQLDRALTTIDQTQVSSQKGRISRERSVLLHRLDPVEERRVDQAEDGEAAAYDGAQLREEVAEALALFAVHDAVRRDVLREDGIGYEALLRVGRVRLEVCGAELVVVGRVLEGVAHLLG
jgi:hypothetical protein